MQREGISCGSERGGSFCLSYPQVREELVNERVVGSFYGFSPRMVGRVPNKRERSLRHARALKA